MSENSPSPTSLEPASLNPGRRGKWQMWIGAAMALVLLVGAATLFVRNARRDARASYRASGFRHAIMDMRSFSDLPLGYDGDGGGPMSDVIAENGDRLLSWRVWLTDHSLPLPGDSRADYQKSWNDSRNLRTAANGLYDFTNRPMHSTSSDDDSTTILAITGPGTVFGDGMPMALKAAPGAAIVLVEVRNSGVHWMSPKDFDIRTMPHTINDPEGRGISGETSLGFHVAFADGEVWRLSHNTPFEELSRFFVAEDAKRLDREAILGKYRGTRWPAAK